ncbi:MAG: hypothetical protein II816_04260, partial [Elusimicrobia bacterium]|nr:hypothetical protein [Elusimicrobiota bacterium]
KSVLDELLPESKLQKTTFMCVWPIQSARYTVDGRPRDRYHRVDDKFISFINSVKKYHKKGRDTMIFVPRYLKQEMAAYFKDEDILSKFSEISYFNSDNKKQTIEMLKKDGLTIIMYDGGMRGVHNEQAYIESVTSAYNDGSRNFNSMLTQAGYKWKGNIIYFYEGKEIGTNEDDENVNETIENAIKESLKKPYIKKGKVQYIIDILRKAFKTYRGLRKNINRYMRGNWINVFTVMQENINLVGPEEIMSANKALGFNSISVIPIKKSLLSEQNYKKAETFEKNGETISIYTVKQKSGTIYLVGIENSNTQWQDVALLYIKKDTSLKDGFFNSIISFDGEPQLSYGEITSESYFGSKYIPVVVGGKTKKNKAEERGYIFVDDMKDLHLATSDPRTKYSNFEKDISSAYRNQKIMKAIEQKSLFKNLNKFYVGFKIATDEHVLRPEEYNGFIKSMEFSPVNFITAVVRDNDLSTHVDKDKNSVKENLIKLSKDLHQKDIKFLLEYTFGFFDESFDDFVRTIGQDVKDIGVDGIKIDMVDCSVEQFGKVLKDFETLLKNLKQVNSNIFFTVQVSDEVWQEYQNFFERLNITKTNSSKDELFFERRNISIKGKTNNEISPYENLAERESQLFMMQSLNQSLSIDGYNSDFDRGRKNIGADNNTLLDKRLTYRLIDMLEKYVNDESVGTLTLPMNLFYLKENNENPIIIQAIYALMYHFIEQRVLQDKMKIAYDFGSKQDVILSAQQEEDIAEILRGEGDISAETYVIEHFPQVFDYSIETETSIKAISDSFLYGIYEANIIRRYKEGDFGKVLKFVKQLFADSPDVLEQRQQTFYKLLTHIVLFKDRMNIKDVFSVSDEEFVTYNDQTEEGKILNNYIKALASNWDMRGRLEALEQMLIGFEGYTKNRESSVYIARLLIDGLLRAYKTEEIEPLPKEIVIEDVIDIDIFEQENDTLIMDINNMLSNA